MVQERHLHRNHISSLYPESLGWKTWIGGSYKFIYPSKEASFAEVAIQFDWITKFEKDAEYSWKIEVKSEEKDGLSGRAAVYPGVHQGMITHTESQPEWYEVKWITPIFSPFVFMNSPSEWDENLFSEKTGAVIGGSAPANRNAATEKIPFVSRGRYFRVDEETVLVIERVLRSICAFLVFGPQNSSIPEAYQPKVGHVGRGSNYDITTKFFEKTGKFANAASFFCRAYVPQARQDQSRKVTEAEKKSTIDAVIAMLEHHTILQDPFWIEDENWADNLESDVQSVKTLKEWRLMEKKWATLTSFACGLRLHEGPWAGKDWEKYIFKED